MRDHDKYFKAMSDQLKARQERDEQVVGSFLYEDYTLLVRRDGQKYKVPRTRDVTPFPIVMAGKLPDAGKIKNGNIN
jgi:hypothetical protein